MNILVDTPIWSLAFRRKGNLSGEESSLVQELKTLIQELRAAIVGPIRQEILSGIADPGQYALLRHRMRAFDDVPLSSVDYEIAADFFNTCRRQGIQGSHIDFLLCAAAHRHAMPIFTTDSDFQRYADCLEISLYRLRGS